MIIDKMKLKDVEKVHKISEESFSSPWSLNSIQEEVYNEMSYYLVARSEEGETLGYAGSWIVFDECQITNIAVDKNYRRHGIAKLLLTKLINDMKEREMSFIFLEVRESNIPARHFYESMGFYYAGRRRGFYKDGEDALLMNLDL